VVSGIARPATFELACEATGLDIPVAVRFRDHHWYSAGDETSIGRIMDRYDCTGVLTTEKDVWKLPARLRSISLILKTRLDLLEPEAFWRQLDGRLGV
jgi:tetraacyldisaccharide-1-P 4'-kinase